VNDYFNS
jgi:hypothetical protein